MNLSRRNLVAAAAAAVTLGRAGTGATDARHEGVAVVSASMLSRTLLPGLMDVALPLPDRPLRRRLATTRAPRDAAGALVARLRAQGRAAGNVGDVYDNRDRGHSGLRADSHPELTFAAYDLDLRAQGLDYGLNARLRFPGPTVGNSSTAIKTEQPHRSLVRAAMLSAQTMAALSALYAANHLYVYPEHRDHDPPRGDLYPANIPHLVISQGSSRSDRPFVEALLAIYAAFRPDTKQRLVEAGLLAAAAQMALRRGMAGISDAERYMSSAAHPTVFDPARIELERMAALANAIPPEAIPSAPLLRLLDEPAPRPGVDIFGDGLDERLFETPEAIARVARGMARDRRYRLNVADTLDPNGRALTFHWRVLRGPGVAVRPLDGRGLEAEVLVPWTAPYAAPGPEGLSTSRIDVAVFADNGATLSAPAFFCVVFPPDERREHDLSGALLAADGRAAGMPDVYVDPRLFPLRDWRDERRHDLVGRLVGWTRVYPDGGRATFTGHGFKVVSLDHQGRPETARAVAYPVVPARRGRPRIVETETDRMVVYRYRDADDMLGEAQAG